MLGFVSASVLIACIASSLGFAQPRGADAVVSFNPGTGSGIFDPARALGLPRGLSGPSGFAGSDVCSLGQGGSLTLSFAQPIVNGPGLDFLAFENVFEFPSGSGRTFSEVAFVSVSSNGQDFARFRTSYAGPAQALDPFGSEPMGTYEGFCGSLPTLADAVLNALLPFDPTEAGGEGFDLQDLAQDPLVLLGLVDLGQIRFVRFDDTIAGVDQDSLGRLVFDHGGNPSSADIEAVVAIHSPSSQTNAQPRIALEFDTAGHLVLRLSHGSGLSAIDPASIQLSVNSLPFSVIDLLAVSTVSLPSSNELVLTTQFPLANQGLFTVIAARVFDQSGRFSADQLFVQG